MKQKTLLLPVLLLFSACLFAQDSITFSGTVRDEKNQPLAGATISTVIQGKRIGTTADDKGNYALKVPAGTKTVTISYIGYDDKVIPIAPGQTNYALDISMTASEVSLNQVVVTVSRRKEKLLDAPASISVIGQEQLEDNVVTTPVDELKNTAGVDIIRTGLISSDVVVRGFNNIFSGTALNVIDNRIGSVPSLRVNAYQLVPTSDLDYQNIEVVRGPASALYGPNASSGVVAITTKSPLEQEKKFETTVEMMSGFTVLDKAYQQYNSGHLLSGNILNPEIRHSGKLFNGKFGYKISGGYFQGQDYPYYSATDPKTGDSLIFGNRHNGQLFTPDTLGYTIAYDSATRKNDTTAKLDIRQFNKNFFIRKWHADARVDIHPVKDVTLTISGGVVSSHNIELTGLGEGVAGGDNGGWMYWNVQAQFKWKNLYVQYYIDASNSGNTYLIPQASPLSTPPYDVQLLVDRSKMHVIQVQHSWRPIEKLNFVYGVDVQLTRPNTEGTIDGQFESIAKLNQVGGYIQGTYDVLKWLSIVAAGRVDYNSFIENAAVSPRAALVFKVAENQDIRLTYNRAFDSPNTLNQFLDLAQESIGGTSSVPNGNGMNAVGIGNPYGWNYNFSPQTGVVEFKTAPWGGAPNSGTWVPYGSKTANVAMFDSIESFLTKNFAQAAGSFAPAIVGSLLNGIGGPNGTVANASLQAYNLINFSNTGNFQSSLIQNPTNVQNLKRINNQYTQTLELGYKGFLFRKLSVQVDAYWTRISNYVSALTPASEAVVFNPSFLGPENSSGILYRNILASSIVTTDLKLTPQQLWQELVNNLSELPIGAITPNSPYVNSDYILTYINEGLLDVLGIDLSLQYLAYEDSHNKFSLGATFDYVDKDDFVVGPQDTVRLNSPKIKAGITTDYTNKKTGLGGGLGFRYQQAYYANSAVYIGPVQPAYLLDAHISYRPNFYKGLLLSINVNNVTNYQWSPFPGVALMGTQFYAKAQVTF